MTEEINSTILVQKQYTNPEILNRMQNATNLVIHESYFAFSSKIYKQFKRVPIESPISNVIAKWKRRIMEGNIIHNHKN